MDNKPSVNIIGSGNVATHIFRRLMQRGCHIAGIYSRTLEHAQALAQDNAETHPTNHLEDLPTADVYVISVKDSALEAVAEELCRSNPHSEALFLHTAGSMPIEVLSRRFRNAAVVYPMQTFSKTRAVDFSTIPTFVEGKDTGSMAQALDFAHLLSGNVSELSTEGRKALHLAAVFACNFVNHSYSIAFQLLEKAGIDPSCLLPLMDETALKAHTLHPAEAQTGPAVRWDENVMALHAELLKENPLWLDIYKNISQSIHQTAISRHDKL